MAGVALLLLFAAYVAGGIKIVSCAWRTGSSRAVTIALAGVLLLPSADAIVGRQFFHNYCRTQGQLMIRDAVKGVDGIAVQSGVFKDSPTYYGYGYVEGGYSPVNYRDRSAPWMFERAEVVRGQVEIVRPVVPKAKYMLHQGLLEQSFYFNRSRVSVIEISTGRELGGFTKVGFRGGWAEKVIGAFASSGPQNSANCPSDFKVERSMTQQLLRSTLVPTPA
jgi:hypothetical protein